MRILLVGDNPLDRSLSMPRYVAMLRDRLRDRGHHVDVIQVRPFFGKMAKRPSLVKWLGYLDKFVLFPPELRRKSRGYDLVHVCDHSNAMFLAHVRAAAASITCHDLLAVASALGQYREQRISVTGRILQRWIRTSLQRAQAVICISHETARQLNKFSPNPGRKVEVVHNPLNYAYQPAGLDAVRAVRSRFGLEEGEYLIHVGANSWYKNRLGTLRIYRSLRDVFAAKGRTSPRMLMVGQPMTAELKSYIAEHGLMEGERPAVIEAVNVAEADLEALYTGASALLFPSLYEGFGWPVAEAQSCGCPAIVSDRAPLPEVAGGIALLIDPADEPGAATRIEAEYDRLTALREPGLENARRFAPEHAISAYERFFLEVAGSAIESRDVAAGRWEEKADDAS